MKDVCRITAQSDDIFRLLELAQTNTALVGLALPLVLAPVCITSAPTSFIRDLKTILHGYHAVHIWRLVFWRQLRLLLGLVVLGGGFIELVPQLPQCPQD